LYSKDFDIYVNGTYLRLISGKKKRWFLVCIMHPLSGYFSLLITPVFCIVVVSSSPILPNYICDVVGPVLNQQGKSVDVPTNEIKNINKNPQKGEDINNTTKCGCQMRDAAAMDATALLENLNLKSKR
jgi:hypothetical protein